MIAVIGSVAIAAGAAVAAVELSDSGPHATVDSPRTAPVDVTPIAKSSSAAVRRSGRAHVVFELQAGTPLAQQGTNDVAWSGHDIEMKVHIEANGANTESNPLR